MTTTRPPDAASAWRLYARHAAIVFAGGPAPSSYVTERAFFAASGVHHVDLNQGALFGQPTATDARDVVGLIEAAGVPVLFGCSKGVVERAGPVLAGAGFVPLPTREHLFWMPETPQLPQALEGHAFEVRRVATDADIAAMQAMFVEAHDYGADLTGPMYAAPLRAGDDLSGWLAWDGAEPVSFAIVTQVGSSLSLCEVMTPERHRRRGGARAVVTAALDHVGRAAAAAGQPIEQTLFWSSPAGQPLYESMGFAIVDTVDVWALGASATDLAAVGA